MTSHNSFLTGMAYFVGSWIFWGLMSIVNDVDQRFVVIFFVMPFAFLVFTAGVQMSLCFITGKRNSYFLHVSLGAFIGISCFLFSLDGLEQVLNSDGFFQLLCQFSIPGVGAIAAGVGALGSHVVTRVFQPSRLEGKD